MKKSVEEKLSKDGVKTTIRVIETTPQDGFVPLSDINHVNMNNRGKYHKGYSKHISISTNDPRITRPFVYGICGLFGGIGIIILLISLLIHEWVLIILGFFFVIFSVFGLFKGKKDIDNIEEERLKNPNYDPKDKEAIRKFRKDMKDATSNVMTSVLTSKGDNNEK